MIQLIMRPLGFSREVVVTVIKSEGIETKSKPAEAGDMVVRKRCSETDNEQYLVRAAQFAKRYGTAMSEADQGGWRAYQPTGVPTRFVALKGAEGPFTFKAPWGETQIAKPGDVIAQDPSMKTTLTGLRQQPSRAPTPS